MKVTPFDSKLHREAWMILCANNDYRKLYEQENSQLQRIFVTGYPKFDALCKEMKQTSWPIRNENSKRKFRIIWAPHHSIAQHPWFGVFDKISYGMLNWVKTTDDIEIVLRPHPALLEQASVPSMPNFHHDMIQFLKEWNALPNTAISLNDNYAHLFSASDCMVTDGISFLTEYPLSGKPLIFFSNPHHTPFNLLGEKCMEATYTVKNMHELKKIIAELEHHHDPLEEKRIELRKYLMPYGGHVAERVLSCIRKELPK